MASWSSIEYGGKWKQLHYFAKNFNSPVITVALQKDGKLEIVTVNDLRDNMEIQINANIYDFDGNMIENINITTEIKSGSSRTLKRFKLKDFTFDFSCAFMIIETVSKEEKDILIHSNTHFFQPYKSCELRKTNVNVRVIENENNFIVELFSDKPAFFVNIETPGIKGIFNDNCITLLPNKTVSLKFNPKQKIIKQELKKSIRVKHLVESYS